jgi:hypothetical protein
MPGQLPLGQVSAESHASQQGQPEENRRGLGPPAAGWAQASNATRLPRGVVAS